jgi:flagellar protein FliS
MNRIAQTYTNLSVEGASPVGLVVALYDNALMSLHRARRAMEANDIQLRTQYLNHVLCIIAHLQGTLDLEKGGEVAETLMKFYSYARARILEVSLRNSREMLADLASHFSSLRDAWNFVESQSSDGQNSMSGRA